MIPVANQVSFWHQMNDGLVEHHRISPAQKRDLELRIETATSRSLNPICMICNKEFNKYQLGDASHHQSKNFSVSTDDSCEAISTCVFVIIGIFVIFYLSTTVQSSIWSPY